MRYPGTWEAVLLALAAYRLWKLAAEDKITDRPRDWLVARIPEWAEEWLACPWCAGFWIGGAVWAGWWWWPTATLAILTPLWLNVLVVGAKHAIERTAPPE